MIFQCHTATILFNTAMSSITSFIYNRCKFMRATLGALLEALSALGRRLESALSVPFAREYTCFRIAHFAANSLTWAEMADLSPADRQAVLRQLERLLASGHFRNSRRYTDLLRFVVQQTLEGRADSLKERTLGIEVFGREPGFDTAGDSIVRVAAAEVRKRIAQYYQEEGHETELRVDLPSGSYVARFRAPLEAAPATDSTPESSEPPSTSKTAVSTQSSAVPARWKGLSFAATILLLIAVAAVLALRARSDSGMNRFWGPVFESSAPVLICVGTVEPPHKYPDFRKRFTPQMANSVNGAEESAAPEASFVDWPAVTWTDAVEMTRITEMLTKHNRPFLFRSSENATLADLRNGPVILLGVLENAWTLRFASKLRFHPRMDYSSQTMWIEDAQHPERRNWSAPWGVPYTESNDDYSLVTRTRNPLSGQVTVVLGGLGMHASQAAGEFATNPASLNALSSSLRDPNRNVQIVLKINVVKGEAGPPQIVAEYYW
jgi:hypothetical protein